MSFISYSQNFEDVMLWRALKHVHDGFYIDVGANNPLKNSVSRGFYEQGWRGINIEPMTQYFDLCRSERPRDVNVQAVVSDRAGEVPFFNIPDSALSTVDAEQAEVYRKAGRTVLEQRIKSLSLSDLCAEHVRGPIHFMKIDAEGSETAVLRGMNFAQWRPWILVIEATVPETRILNSDQWESIVLQANYEHAYFDGLNQFYVAAEHASLIDSFALAPNVFDDFQLREGHHFSFRGHELEHRCAAAEREATQARNDLNYWKDQVLRSSGKRVWFQPHAMTNILAKIGRRLSRRASSGDKK